MGKALSLTAKDAHRLGAYRADPKGKPRGGVVVVQEIFGVNHHIRSVCDRLAALDYTAVAPGLFDRFVAPWALPIERLVPPPIGLSLFAVGRPRVHMA